MALGRLVSAFQRLSRAFSTPLLRVDSFLALETIADLCHIRGRENVNIDSITFAPKTIADAIFTGSDTQSPQRTHKSALPFISACQILKIGIVVGADTGKSSLLYVDADPLLRYLRSYLTISEAWSAYSSNMCHRR